MVKSYKKKSKSFSYDYEHVYMRPEVNLNRFEISPWGKISLRCEVILLSAFTWLRDVVKLTSVKISLQSNWPKSNFKPQWVFLVNSKCPRWNKYAQNQNHYIRCSEVKCRRNLIFTWILKRWLLRLIQEKNDGFWLMWGIFKEYIKQNIITTVLRTWNARSVVICRLTKKINIINKNRFKRKNWFKLCFWGFSKKESSLYRVYIVLHHNRLK